MQLPPCAWPEDLGAIPPMMTVAALRAACQSFPDGTGLGWDGLHPKALLRLPDSCLRALVRILFVAEAHGRWPAAMELVIIALIPKSDGGRRPIGLLPWLPRIWARVRRTVARQWEEANSRDYLFAGVGKGADIAAWKQAFRAEASVQVQGGCYLQVLLDLVKAFDRVPYHVLVREAVALGFPL